LHAGAKNILVKKSLMSRSADPLRSVAQKDVCAWESGMAEPRQDEQQAQQGAEGFFDAERIAAAETAAAGRLLSSGSEAAGGAQEITAAWARYAERVMHHTSEASQALLRAQSFSEMLEIQAKLMRDNMQAFLDQSVAIAEAAGRMAKRPLEVLKDAGAGRPRP
jgi:hypothetical protein